LPPSAFLSQRQNRVGLRRHGILILLFHLYLRIRIYRFAIACRLVLLLPLRQNADLHFVNRPLHRIGPAMESSLSAACRTRLLLGKVCTRSRVDIRKVRSGPSFPSSTPSPISSRMQLLLDQSFTSMSMTFCRSLACRGPNVSRFQSMKRPLLIGKFGGGFSGKFGGNRRGTRLGTCASRGGGPEKPVEPEPKQSHPLL
jgi:hypothetical protein